MQYNPVKTRLNRIFSRSVALKKLFFTLLDILLLRSWYVRGQIRWIRKQAGPRAKVLDAGAGLGQYVWNMARQNPGWEITGADISEEHVGSGNVFLEKARIGNATFQQMDLTRLEEENNYNLIVCVDVMEHIEEDRKVLNAFYKALKPDGFLIISTPSDQGGSDVHHQGDSSFIDEHVRDGYNALKLEEKLRSAGFHCVHLRYSYGTFGSMAWRLTMKYPIQMLNAHKAFLFLLPLYYLPVMPFALLLNMADTMFYLKKGTGLIVRARKITGTNQQP